MTIIQDIEDAIAGHFNTEWAGATPIAFENIPFDTEAQTNSWVRFAIRHGAASTTVLSAKRIRRTARIFVQVFTPADRGGRETANDLAENVLDILEARGLSPHEIILEAGIPREIGTSDGWYQVNVEVPFTYIKRTN